MQHLMKFELDLEGNHLAMHSSRYTKKHLEGLKIVLKHCTHQSDSSDRYFGGDHPAADDGETGTQGVP